MHAKTFCMQDCSEDEFVCLVWASGGKFNFLIKKFSSKRSACLPPAENLLNEIPGMFSADVHITLHLRTRNGTQKSQTTIQ